MLGMCPSCSCRKCQHWLTTLTPTLPNCADELQVDPRFPKDQKDDDDCFENGVFWQDGGLAETTPPGHRSRALTQCNQRLSKPSDVWGRSASDESDTPGDTRVTHKPAIVPESEVVSGLPSAKGAGVGAEQNFQPTGLLSASTDGSSLARPEAQCPACTISWMHSVQHQVEVHDVVSSACRAMMALLSRPP